MRHIFIASFFLARKHIIAKRIMEMYMPGIKNRIINLSCYNVMNGAKFEFSSICGAHDAHITYLNFHGTEIRMNVSSWSHKYQGKILHVLFVMGNNAERKTAFQNDFCDHWIVRWEIVHYKHTFQDNNMELSPANENLFSFHLFATYGCVSNEFFSTRRTNGNGEWIIDFFCITLQRWSDIFSSICSVQNRNQFKKFE